MAQATSLIRLICCVLCFVASSSQYTSDPKPYEDLPDEVFTSSGGNFSFPVGITEQYDEGTVMGIRWNTDYPSVNLYLVYNASLGHLGQQYQLLTGYSSMSYDWTLECKTGGIPDCEAPFAFKAVNATGSDAQLLNGGFWTRQFWIRPGTTTASTSMTSATSTSTSTTSATSLSSASSAATSTTRISTPSTTALTSSPDTTTATSSSIPSDKSGSSVNITAIGIGIGAGVGSALLFVGVFLLWRHKRKGRTMKSSESTISFGASAPYSPRPQDSKSPALYYQYPQAPAEVPGHQADPHELPARNSRYR